jgi:hypothetical protein
VEEEGLDLGLGDLYRFVRITSSTSVDFMISSRSHDAVSIGSPFSLLTTRSIITSLNSTATNVKRDLKLIFWNLKEREREREP